MLRKFRAVKTMKFKDTTLTAGSVVYEVHYTEAQPSVISMVKNTKTLDGSVFFLYEGIVRLQPPGETFLSEEE